MNKKIFIGISAVVGAGLLNLYLKRRKKMNKTDDVTSRFSVPDFEFAVLVNRDDPKAKMDNIERGALIDVVKAMDDEEIDIFLDNIPIDRIMKRLERELEKNKVFREAVEAAVPVDR